MVVISQKVWSRLKSDTSKSFEAFTIYRDMGKERTLERVSKELNKSMTLIGRWSSRHNWKERAKEYDKYLDSIKQKEKEEEIIRTLRNHTSISRAIQAKIVEKLDEMEASEINPSSLANMFSIAVEVERKSLGIDKREEEKRRGTDEERALSELFDDLRASL